VAAPDLDSRPWRAIGLPAEVERVPTMLSSGEQQLLYWLARDYVSGEGAVVDGGCFIGGSTTALLAGLRDRSTRWNGPPLETYDKFRVEAYEIPQFFAGTTLAVGDSFRPVFDANVRSFDVPHVVHEGDIIEIGWSGGPIELLFLDVLKSWKINDAVLHDFFPHLSPGSVIVQQDYGWAGPWIHITIELIRDSVRLIDYMKAGSHVFLVESELDEDLLARGIRGLSLDEQLEILQRAIDRSSGWPRGMLELSRAGVLKHVDREEALAQVNAIEERYEDPYVRLCAQYVRDGFETDQMTAAVRHAERVS
jgi:hypothetical protein